MRRTDEVLPRGALPVYDVEPGERVVFLDARGRPAEAVIGADERTFRIPAFEACGRRGRALADGLAAAYPGGRHLRTFVDGEGGFGAALFGVPSEGSAL